MWYSKLNVFILSLLCVFGIATQAEAAETYERTKTVYRSFGCNENSSVELTNQHGDIYINTWSEDSVAFSITIEAYSEKSEHLEDLLSMIEIEFNDYSSYIIAETQQAKNSTLLNKAAFGLSKLSGSREIRVNYQVYLPENIELSIENEFGDVYIGTHTGEFNLELSHGDLRAKKLENVKVIKAKYGEVKIDEAQGGRFDFSYVKGAQLGSLQNVFMKSTYSEIDIDEMNILRLESRLDEIYVSELGSINGKTSLSKVHIRTLRETADLESKFGNLRVDEISSSSGELNFKGTNTDYTLGFSAGVTGTFEIQMTGNKAFNSDKDYLNIQDTSQIDDKTTFYNGKINDSSSGIKLTLQSKNGEVNIGG